jgi:hypothetical protein
MAKFDADWMKDEFISSNFQTVIIVAWQALAVSSYIYTIPVSCLFYGLSCSLLQ